MQNSHAIGHKHCFKGSKGLAQESDKPCSRLTKSGWKRPCGGWGCNE